VRFLVPGQVAEQPKFFGTMFTEQITDRMTQQVFLIIALVPEDLVAGLTEKLHLGLLFLHLLQRRVAVEVGHRRRIVLATVFTHRVQLHVFAESHGSSEDSAALCARVLPLTFVLNLMIVQQGLRGEEDTAEFTMIRQRKIILIVRVVHLLLYDVLHGTCQSRSLLDSVR